MRASHPIASSMLLLAAAVLLSLTGGCGDDSSTGPSSGETWRMETLTVATAILGPGDSTLVRARVVLDDGVTGAAGKQVLFGEMLDRESGTFAPQAATTDASGWAEALYRADRGYWGLVTLKARSGESTSYVQLLLQASQAGSDVLTISSPSNATAIPADGTSLLSLQVHVTRGLDGEPLANATVRLAAGDRFVDNDRDGAFTSGDQLLQGGDLNQNGSWDPLGTVPAAVVTDGSGTAEFTIRAASTPGTTWVHASSDDGETDFAIVFHPTTLLLEVHAVESEMMADGLRESEVYAIVTDWEGRPVQGVVVQFTAGEPFEDLDGDGQYTDPTDIFSDTNGNGRWDVMGAIGSHATTQHDGTATVLYRAGVDPGDVTIQARTRGVEAQAIVHLLRMPSAYRMSLEAEGGPIYADGTSRAPVSIQVWDVNQTALPGKRILLAAGEPFDDVDGNGVWTPGVDRLRRDQNGDRTWNAIGSVPASVVTGDGGRAYVDLVSGMEPGETTLKATVDGVSEEITIQLLSLPPVTRLDLVTDNESIRTRGSGGDDAATLTATCFDALGARVPAGLTVRFTIASGPDEGETILGGQEGVFTTQTNADGEAIAVLQAGTAPGLVQVLAEAGAAQRTITVQIASGPPAGLFCEANPEEIDTEGTSEILVHLYDERHNPVDGAWVRFESDWGIIEGMDGPATSISSNGVARALFQCPVARPGDDGIARITCHAEGTDLSCIALVRIPTSPVSIAGLTLTSPATRLVVKDAGGTDETTLEVIAIDAQGRPCLSLIHISE
ncbi:MAG: hypothetical protein QUU85_04755, partial [Candidatus Eisenbacteria bacterium]|nr:hypothetical protein [Candidatus Eisenbacteria bacterium]